MEKITVVVEGGVLRTIYHTIPIELELIDLDDSYNDSELRKAHHARIDELDAMEKNGELYSSEP